MSSHLQAEFEKLWLSAQTPPDVGQFLRTLINPSPEQIGAIIRLDQQFRWRTASPLKVEHYVSSIVGLEHHPGLLLKLVANEFQARLQNQQTPEVDDYLRRFPQLQEQLREKLSGMSSTADGSGTSPNTSAIEHEGANNVFWLMKFDEICDDETVFIEWEHHPNEYMLHDRVSEDALQKTVLKPIMSSSQSVPRTLRRT